METILQLPESFQDDLRKLRDETERFQRGEVSAAEYRSFRVPRGVYEQRESDTYMLRARCPAGAVLPHQMRALASVSQQYGNGILHVTTRQDVQVHRVLLDNLYPALVELNAAGLSTRGGGGNTVRNITGCCDAGICPDEVFDVSPHVVALTESLLPDPLSYQLPRKYKLAFSGCSRDCAGATVNDLGFIAKTKNGEAGFSVHVAGGMGLESRTATLFEEFVPAAGIHEVAEAVKRVFDQHGNRKNRNKARLRFLIEQIGLPRFRELYEHELNKLRTSRPEFAVLREFPGGSPAIPQQPASREPGDGAFDLWLQRNTTPQKQPDRLLIHIPLKLGDIDADRLTRFSHVVEQFGERLVRTTQSQNFVLRWVHESELHQLYSKLAELDLALPLPPVLRNLIACTGAATCRLGICLSRGLATAVSQELSNANLDLDAARDLRIHISGCPNACGRHPIADIGLHGVARRVNGRLMPHYVVQVGGRVAEGETRFAEGDTAVPAKSLPRLIRELVESFRASSAYPDFGKYLDESGRMLLASLAEKHQCGPDSAANDDFHYDWSASEPFSLAGRGPGECGAGVFDLIEVDLKSAREAVGNGRLLDAIVLTARSLLVTRGLQAEDAAQTLDFFKQYFVDEKLVDAAVDDLIVRAKAKLSALQSSEHDFAESEVSQFVDAVSQLYASMDASLRFKPVALTLPTVAPVERTAETPTDRQADFRGVICPLNYVKTKMLLDRMRAGETLSVLLDEPGTRNVPDSVRQDGHSVLAIDQVGTHWKVVIRKA